MNNLSYSSYQKPLHVVHAIVSAPGSPETVIRTLPDAFEAGSNKKSTVAIAQEGKDSKAEQDEEHQLSNYQPVTHASILPVHHLLF